MGIETEEDVRLLSSYFLKHRAATRDADASSETVRAFYLLTYLLIMVSSASVEQYN